MKASIRRQDKGFATVIGAIFFLLTSMLIVTFMFEAHRKQMEMYNYEREVLRERVDVTITISRTLGFNMTIDNNGHETVEIIRFWVIDLTGNTHYNYSLPIGKRVIPSHHKVNIQSHEISGFTTLIVGRYYAFRLITARGNIIEPNPIKALPGNIASTYPQYTIEIPTLPWVSNATIIISRSRTETPVYNISRKHDETLPYDGGKAYLSIKNIYDITIFLTGQSRIVFKGLTEPYKSYASHLSKWYIYIWDEKDRKWRLVDSNDVTHSHDTIAIYKNMVIVLEFETPSEVPGDPQARYKIVSGKYDVYLLLEGYDTLGRKFISTVYYGVVRF